MVKGNKVATVKRRLWVRFPLGKLIINYFTLASHASQTSHGAAARGVTAKPTGCGFDPNVYLKFIFPFLRSGVEVKRGVGSATQHAMPPEFGRKLGTECLSTGFPLPTLLCAGYSVKLFFFTSLWYQGKSSSVEFRRSTYRQYIKNTAKTENGVS